MADHHRTQERGLLEEAITTLFCLVDDAYAGLNPKGRRYASLKRLSDSEVLTLVLFQQLRGVESERSFLRDASRFFAHLFPGVVGLAPSSLHRRVRKLRRFLEPLRRTVVPDLSSAIPKRWSWTRACSRSCAPGRSASPRAGEGPRPARPGYAGGASACTA